MDIKIIKHSDIANCPKRSLLPQHYRDDGTCLCDSYGHPETAPNLSISADGETVLKRYHVFGVVYAKDREAAQRAVDLAAVYLDRARLEE
jgi:hypothetical protein